MTSHDIWIRECPSDTTRAKQKNLTAETNVLTRILDRMPNQEVRQ